MQDTKTREEIRIAKHRPPPCDIFEGVSPVKLQKVPPTCVRKTESNFKFLRPKHGDTETSYVPAPPGKQKKKLKKRKEHPPMKTTYKMTLEEQHKLQAKYRKELAANIAKIRSESKREGGNFQPRGLRRGQCTPPCDIFEGVSPVKLQKVPPTCVRKTASDFKFLRPKHGDCLDYNISQTLMKMDAAGTVINVKDTETSYVPAPPGKQKKKRKKRKEHPPMKTTYKMTLEEQHKLQAKYRKELAANIAKIRSESKREGGNFQPRGLRRGQCTPPCDIFEGVSPVKLQKVPPTCVRKTASDFKFLRPKHGDCLDYNISQTLMKMDAAGTVINVKDTETSYVPAPPGKQKKKRKKRKEHPPMKTKYKMTLEEQHKLQAKYRKELAANIAKIRSESKREGGNFQPRGLRRGQCTPPCDIFEGVSPVKLQKVPPTCVTKTASDFKFLRPKHGDCLDYNISQTVMKMDAAGTVINIKDTETTYVPAPPRKPKKKRKKRNERPPMKFIYEIWLEEQDKLQEKYRKELAVNIRKARIESKREAKERHESILAMAGPVWFQELSPKQIRTVDQLHCCILTDLENKTITNVQHNIDKLGLVLMPNHKHIQKALCLCRKDPVEFLLILYQLMNPKRKRYSLNDRLLLSAVVHLTMSKTLRELHVRIPSPPPNEKVPIPKPKPRKNVQYPSPYLEPCTFQPNQKKNTCDHPWRQYPESPYFGYLSCLHIERFLSEDIFELDMSGFDNEEVELFEEMKRAQLKHDSLHDGERIKLMKPTIMNWSQSETNLCASEVEVQTVYSTTPADSTSDADKSDSSPPSVTEPDDSPSILLETQNLEEKSSASASIREPLVLPPLSQLDDEEDQGCRCSDIVQEEITFRHDNESCDCNTKCFCKRKPELFASAKCPSCIAKKMKSHVCRAIKGIGVTWRNELVPIIDTTILKKPCGCLKRYEDSMRINMAIKNFQTDKVKYVMGGVVNSKVGPVYMISAVLKKNRWRIIVDPNKQYTMSPEERSRLLLEEMEKLEQENLKELEQRRKERTHQCVCRTSENKEKDGTSSEDTNEYDIVSGSEEECKEEDSVLPCECEKCDCQEQSKKYLLPRCQKCQKKEREKYLQRIITGLKGTGGQQIIPIIEGTRMLNPCDCLQNYVEKILSLEGRNTIQNQSSPFVVGGVTITKIGPVYLISTALSTTKDVEPCKPCAKARSPSRENKKPSKKEEEDIDEQNLKYSGCLCKQELDRVLAHKCTCEECNLRDQSKEVTYVLSGAMATETGTVNVVQGAYGQRCDCLQRYQEKMRKLDEYRMRIEARYNLKSQSLKYSIGGVMNTPEGPVYNITGIRPPVECECAIAKRRQEELDLYLRERATMPPTGRIKYQIAGVRHFPEGNVFIISQALPTEECDCNKLYDTFTHAHQACLDMYEDFLQKTNTAMEQYITDLVNDFSEMPASSVMTDFGQQQKDGSENSLSRYNLFEENELVRTVYTKCSGQKINICSRSGMHSSRDSILGKCVCMEEEEESKKDEIQNTSIDEEEKLDKNACKEWSDQKQVCMENEVDTFQCEGETDQEVVCEDEGRKDADEEFSGFLGCGDICQEADMAIKLVPEPPKKEAGFKRFVILRKIPRNPIRQIRILKKVLAQMAEDGFPLAKLPECHKLFHFKLWMHLRCKKVWKRVDMRRYDAIMNSYWYHIQKCDIKFKVPSLGLTNPQIDEMTWRSAGYIKNLVATKRELFYRKICEKAVDRARETFPLTFSYEFPNNTFKDVFFAYLPSKVRDTYPFNIVKPSDVKIITNAGRYRCC